MTYTDDFTEKEIPAGGLCKIFLRQAVQVQKRLLALCLRTPHKVAQFTLSAKKFSGVSRESECECKTDSFSSIHSGEVAEHRRRLGMCEWRRASPVLTALQNYEWRRAPRCSGAVINKLLFKGGAKYGIYYPESWDGLLL